MNKKISTILLLLDRVQTLIEDLRSNKEKIPHYDYMETVLKDSKKSITAVLRNLRNVEKEIRSLKKD